MFRTIGAVFFVLGLGYALQFPPYIRKCREEDISTCGPDAANTAIQGFLNGDVRYGIPSFLPFHLGETIIDEPHMKFHLTKCQLSGFESIRVFKVEWNNPTGKCAFSIDKLSITGEFPAGGKLYAATFPRAGVANFTLNNVKVYVEVLTKQEKINNDQTRVERFRIHIDVDPESTYYTFSEFSSGVPYVAIDNSEEVTKMILPKFKSALEQALSLSGGRLIELFPLESFFFPKFYAK